MRIAIVGTGVTGLTCTYLLGRDHEVTVFESDDRPGGHANTVDVDLGHERCEADTGFLVFNERTYPGLVRLFAELGIESAPSDMSFSVSDEATGIEWRGTSPSTVFAQRANLVRPRFWWMLAEVARFNRLARRAGAEAAARPAAELGETIEEFLARHRFSATFEEWYLRPLGSSIWSADPSELTEMPLATMARFFERHGLLSIGDQPDWRTVSGGSRRYVERVLAPVRAAGRLRLGDPVDSVRRVEGGAVVTSRHAPAGERFDHVVLATHTDQALKVVEDPTLAEQEVLGAIRYEVNLATLHTDARLMPSTRRAWASWNYHRLAGPMQKASLTYHLNRLQPLPIETDLFLTLNRDELIDPALVVDRFEYAHPVLTTEAVRAQARHGELIDLGHLSYCGAWSGYGFHEDGLQSALRVCERLGSRW